MNINKWMGILGVIGVTSLQAGEIFLHSLGNQWMEINDSTSAMLYFPVGEMEEKSIVLTAFSSDESVIAPTDLTWGTGHEVSQLNLKSNSITGSSVISVVATTGTGLSDTTQLNVVVHNPTSVSAIYDGFISLDVNSGAYAQMSYASDAGVLRRSGENSIEFGFEPIFNHLSPDSKDTIFTTFSTNPSVIEPSDLIFKQTTNEVSLMVFSGTLGGTSIVGVIGEDETGSKDTVSYLVTVNPPVVEEQGSVTSLFLHSLDNQWMEINDSTDAMLYFSVGEMEEKSIVLTAFSSDESVIAPTDLTWGTGHEVSQLNLKSNSSTGSSVISVVATTGTGLSDTTQLNVVVHNPTSTLAIYDGFISLDANSGAYAQMQWASDAGVLRRSGENPIEFAFEPRFSQLSPDSKDTIFTTFSTNPSVIDPSDLIFKQTINEVSLMVFSGTHGGTSIVGVIGEDETGSKDTVSYLVTVNPPVVEDELTSTFGNLIPNVQSIKIDFNNMFLKIQGLNHNQISSVVLYNSQGQLVYSKQQLTNQWNENLNQLTHGQYYLQVNQGRATTSKLLLIK
jgi:hypothetical protein